MVGINKKRRKAPKKFKKAKERRAKQKGTRK